MTHSLCANVRCLCGCAHGVARVDPCDAPHAPWNKDRAIVRPPPAQRPIWRYTRGPKLTLRSAHLPPGGNHCTRRPECKECQCWLHVNNKRFRFDDWCSRQNRSICIYGQYSAAVGANVLRSHQGSADHTEEVPSNHAMTFCLLLLNHESHVLCTNENTATKAMRECCGMRRKLSRQRGVQNITVPKAA